MERRISKFAPGPGLGPLSHRQSEFQNQTTLVLDQKGRIRFAAIGRRVLALPHEILAEIFVQCLPDDVFINPSYDSAPLILCGVCRQWRIVALTTSKLWSSLHVVLHDAGLAGHVESCRRWISRASTTPLSLKISDYGWDVADPAAQALLQTIASLSLQWRNVHIAHAQAAIPLLLPIAGKFPLLERLTIMSRHDNEHTMSFLDAPNLRQLHALEHHSTNFLPLPWTQITLFQADRIRLPPCIQILRHASNLVDCILYVVQVNNEPGAPLQVSLSPLIRMQSLTLGGHEGFVSVLKSLTTPALKDLTLRFPVKPGRYDHYLAIPPLLAFVSRSSFQLHRLVFYHMAVATKSVILCLKAVPSLVHFKLTPTHPMDMNEMYRQLTRSPDFLPKLESFHAIYTHHAPVLRTKTVPVLVNMLCWRWAGDGITKLRSFQLAHTYIARDFDEAFASHSEINRLAVKGMRLYVGRARPDIDSIPT
ncbi:hypothetical protein B0H11DRAFT_1232449 [Mycena galericulata]|nr:hypothetical protein B0H11DRAFT_1232449 [Mycena galericulata]